MSVDVKHHVYLLTILLRLIDDVTDQLNVRPKPGILLTIDYCQAFDRISNDFMIHTLKQIYIYKIK